MPELFLNRKIAFVKKIRYYKVYREFQRKKSWKSGASLGRYPDLFIILRKKAKGK